MAPDALGALFLVVVSAVALVAAVFGIGYAEGAAASRTGWLAFVAVRARVSSWSPRPATS